MILAPINLSLKTKVILSNFFCTFKIYGKDLNRVKTMVVVGESADILKSLADKNNVNCIKAIKIDDATEKASKLAVAGDIILLSPACASWDQYKSFEVRGDEFINTFKKIQSEG